MSKTDKVIEKNQSQYIKVSRQEFKGHELIDIRLYQRSSACPEGYATRKGISIPETLVKPVFEALYNVVSIQTEPVVN